MRNAFLFAVVFAAVLALFCGAAFALPSAGTLKVILYDSTPEAAPLENASVYLSYWGFNSAGGAYQVEEGPFLSDSKGTVTREITADTDKDFVIKANYQDLSTEKIVKWHSGLIVRMTLPLGSLFVKVVDQEGRAFVNKSVTVASANLSFTANTDSNGTAPFKRLSGMAQYTVSAKHGNAMNSTLSGVPNTTKIVLPAYSVKGVLIDDEGRGFPAAEVGYTSSEGAGKVVTDANGAFAITMMPSGNFSLSAFVGGVMLKKSLELAKDEEVALILDQKRPIIERIDVSGSVEGNEPQLAIYVRDDGTNGSGVEKVLPTYSLDGKSWSGVPADKEDGYYAAKLPKFPAGTEVYYKVRVVDFAGNAVEGAQGSFKVGSKSASNGGGSSKSGDGGLGILPYAVVVLLVMIIVTYFGWKKLKGSKEA